MKIVIEAVQIMPSVVAEAVQIMPRIRYAVRGEKGLDMAIEGALW